MEKTELIFVQPFQKWDLFLLSQLLGLNETQEGILNIAFKVADEQGLLLIDIKDLRAMLNYVGAHASELRNLYGNIAHNLLYYFT